MDNPQNPEDKRNILLVTLYRPATRGTKSRPRPFSEWYRRRPIIDAVDGLAQAGGGHFLSSYFTTASPRSKLTRTSSTPSVFFNTCSIEMAQPVQVMPVMYMVVVRVAAGAGPSSGCSYALGRTPMIRKLVACPQTRKFSSNGRPRFLRKA